MLAAATSSAQVIRKKQSSSNKNEYRRSRSMPFCSGLPYASVAAFAQLALPSCMFVELYHRANGLQPAQGSEPRVLKDRVKFRHPTFHRFIDAGHHLGRYRVYKVLLDRCGLQGCITPSRYFSSADLAGNLK